jgi:excisionase family DNA binding protein
MVVALPLLRSHAMENHTEPLRFLTTHETAELLQVSRRTVERMINCNDLPLSRLVGDRPNGGQWRIHEDSLAKWLGDLQQR